MLKFMLQKCYDFLVNVENLHWHLKLDIGNYIS